MSEERDNSQAPPSPDDQIVERGCGTFRIRMAISKLPPGEREATALLLGECPELCQPIGVKDVMLKQKT